MAGLQKVKSEETRKRVLGAAVDLMEEGGLDAVQIRSVAERAGYSVGSVYKHYADIDALIIAVNSITLERIHQVMRNATEGLETPIDRLKALAHAYSEFSRENPKLWKGLFDHHLPESRSIPEEHKLANVALLSLIGGELKALDPSMGEDELAARTRTCFGAVHGLVTISLEERFAGLSGDTLSSELDFLVQRLAEA
ncbi:TetR family transcriptional regulator [Stappia sp. GBMRC 2046]|uniref:TetR family transcriptional regulator n=1 Tax=Stappia sediminis TaxID=2692190 RepID=A0A7X3LT19_9HYPH|nr:TetR family transcriptional regulator [Stappia sediminis]